MGSGGEGANLLDAQRVLAEHDHQHARARELADGLTVSGPAKKTFIKRVKGHVRRFPGPVLAERESDRLKRQRGSAVHDDRKQMVACVFDARKALCLLAGSNPDDGPRLEHCRPACANIARDDHHIELVLQEIERLTQQMAIVPEPLRKRMAEEVAEARSDRRRPRTERHSGARDADWGSVMNTDERNRREIRGRHGTATRG